jgi:hypothetical protein
MTESAVRVRMNGVLPRPTITIAPPQEPADVAAVRALFVEYAESLGFSLAYQGFERELAELPGRYAPPTARCSSPVSTAWKPAWSRFDDYRPRSPRSAK